MSRPIRMTARIEYPCDRHRGADRDRQRRARRSADLQPHELRGRGRDRGRGQGRRRHPRLVPLDPGQCRTVLQGTPPGRSALHARPRAAGVRRLAAAAGRATPISASAADTFVLARRAPAIAAVSGSRASPRSSRTETEKGLDRLSRRRRRIHRRAGARRRHPAAAGDRRLRRQPDRRHPRRQDRRGAGAVHRRQQAREHRRRPLRFLRAPDRCGAEAGRRRALPGATRRATS